MELGSKCHVGQIIPRFHVMALTLEADPDSLDGGLGPEYAGIPQDSVEPLRLLLAVQHGQLHAVVLKHQELPVSGTGGGGHLKEQ